MKNKYIIIMIILCFCLCGCSSGWKNKVQVSMLKYEDNYIIGKMKNLTGKALNVTIKFKLKSGSLIEEDMCYQTLKPNETIDLSCITLGIDETYSIEIDNIELEEFEIPKLEEGTISADVLKYYFKEIYNLHTLSFISFSLDLEEKNYPYINKITYKNNEIEINTEFKNNQYYLTFSSIYDTQTNKLNSIFGLIHYVKDEEFLSNMITNISLMQSLNDYSSNVNLKLHEALRNTDIDKGLCWVVDKWCVKPEKNDNIYNFYISLRD